MISDMKWQSGMDVKDMTELIKSNMSLFKNIGRDIETFLSKCKMTHAKRVFSLDSEHMFVFTQKDFEDSISLMEKYKLKDKESKYMSLYV